MKRIIAGLIAVCALALPSIASAHSGTVTCDTTNVVFTYHADFPLTTTVTEKAGAVTKTFSVPAHTAVTDTIPYTPSGGNNTIVASSTWVGGGSIPPTTLICVGPPPTPNPTPPVQPPECAAACPTPTPPARPFCPVGESERSYENGILTCVVTVIVNPPVPPTPVFPLCPKGTTSLGVKHGVMVCQKVKIKVVYRVTKIVRWVQWCPLPPHHKPGVAG